MVERVGENHAAGENFRERGKRRFVRYITRGKKEPPFLAMEVGKLGFEIDMIVRVAADIARTARPCTHIVQSPFHGGDDLGMLAHRELIVGTQDGNGFGTAVPGKAPCVGAGALVTKGVNKKRGRRT